MLCLKFVKQSSGQALVEAALIVPLIILFLLAILWFARIMLTWQQISTAARYGADLLSYTPFSVKYIESDIKDYLCSANTIGRTIDPRKLNIKIEENDYKPIKYDFDITNFSNFAVLNPYTFLNILKDFISHLNKKSFVEITYTHDIPKIFRIIGNDSIKITARASVLSGTGSTGALQRQK
ncbi:MAG: pilus assembly protein [Endomicrobium sp.]|jgi:hypothetical protein|nr:pilus assembly protein [Endomicrobium sp.]